MLSLTACVGAVDRADFDAEIRSRGGGVAVDWVSDALDVVALEVGATSGEALQIITMTITPSSRTTLVQTRRGDREDFVDMVAVREGEILSVTPQQNADRLPLDDITIAAADLPIGDVDRLADEAILAFTADTGEDPDGGDVFVSLIQVSLIEGVHIVDVSVESARRTGTVRFDTDGGLIGVTG